MKIGIFTDTYLPYPNGVATSVAASVRFLTARGHKVTVIAPSYPGYKDHKNVLRLSSVRIYGRLQIRVALHLPDKALLQALQTDFDIIHGHGSGPVTLIGLEIARIKNIPFVVTYHTMLNKYTHYFLKGKILRPRFMEKYSKILCNASDHIIAPTEKVKKELIRYEIRKPITVLPSGIDLNLFIKGKRGFLQKKYPALKNKSVVLYVGRLGREKSVDFIIKSFALALKKEPDMVLVLVGDGPDKSMLEKLTEKLSINGSVIFTGFIPQKDIPHVYKSADLFVFASQTETQGMVLIEAMDSSLPVLAVDHSAFDETLQSGSNGVLTRKNVTEFAGHILLLLKDTALRLRLAKNAQESVQKFSAKITSEKLEELYQALISSHIEIKGEARDIEFKKLIFIPQIQKLNTKIRKGNTLRKKFKILNVFKFH